MKFPDCDIHHMPQRSDEWFAARRGLLTASDFGPWLLKNDKTSQKARESAICRILAGAANLWQEPNFENAAMKRGTDLEPVAVSAFETFAGTGVTQVGLCVSRHGLFGCSPDGLLMEEGHGFEGKVPVPSTHIAYRRAGVLPEQYLFQVHGGMAVTGATGWWFQSWNPDLANLRVFTPRSEFTEELLAALIAFSKDVEEAYRHEHAAYEAEFGKGDA
jgi:hypothetical protein